MRNKAEREALMAAPSAHLPSFPSSAAPPEAPPPSVQQLQHHEQVQHTMLRESQQWSAAVTAQSASVRANSDAVLLPLKYPIGGSCLSGATPPFLSPDTLPSPTFALASLGYKPSSATGSTLRPQPAAAGIPGPTQAAAAEVAAVAAAAAAATVAAAAAKLEGIFAQSDGAGTYIPSAVTLQGCLHRFVRPESLGALDCWECTRCARLTAEHTL